MMNLTTIKNKITSFARDKSGVAAILGAILLPTMIGGTGLAIDGTRYLRAKSIIITAADQAALAAASVDSTKREQVAGEFFKANIPTEYKDIVDLKSFKFTDNSKKGGAVVVDYTIDATIKTILGGVVGVDKIDLLHKGQAVREISNLEVVLALPVNGTMCSTKSRTPNPNRLVPGDVLLKLDPDDNCTHFNEMKTGARDFVNSLFANQTVSRVKIGLVPYNYKTRMGNVSNIPPLMIEKEINVGGIRNAQPAPNFFSQTDDAGFLPPVTSLTTDKSRLLTALGELRSSPMGVAWSRTNLASLVAGLMLDPTQSQYFPNIVQPASFDDGFTSKIFILMSDGSNIGCCFTNWTPGNFEKQYVYFHKPDNDQTLAYCEAMKKGGIRIFTIIFDVREDDIGGKEVNNIFARCASGSYNEQGVADTNKDAKLKCKNKQNCYNVADANQLKKAYEDIAQNFFISRTSR